MKKTVIIICISLFLILSGSAAFACMADHGSNHNGGDAMGWGSWEDSRVEDFSRNGNQKKSSKNYNDSSRSMSNFNRSDWMGFDGGSRGNNFGYGGGFGSSERGMGSSFFGGGSHGNSNGGGTPFWYCGSAMIDFSNLFSLFSNLNLLSGLYDINEDGQIVGAINIGGTFYSLLLNPLKTEDTSPVPLPGTLLLLGSSAGLFGIIKRRIG
jgi:hypothetical protein